jgi:hypothetical protein
VRKALVGGIFGALIGVLIAVLCFQKDIEYMNVLWGFFVGIFGGFIGTAAFLFIEKTGA